jgi:hypothetical protein
MFYVALQYTLLFGSLAIMDYKKIGIFSIKYKGLYSTSGGLPPSNQGREEMNEKFIKDSKFFLGKNYIFYSYNPSGSTTGIGKYGAFIPGLILQRGHVVSGVNSNFVSDHRYFPAIMFWQTKKANIGLIRGGLTGQEILNDFENIEQYGLHPASLMSVAAKELGFTKKRTIKTIKKAYDELKKILLNNKNKIFNDKEFLILTESVLRKKLDKNMFQGLYGIGTLRTKKDASKSMITLQEFNNIPK